jgi:hypothetical protein
MNKRKHCGSAFKDFLDEAGLSGEVEGRALKQSVRLQLNCFLKENNQHRLLLKGDCATVISECERVVLDDYFQKFFCCLWRDSRMAAFTMCQEDSAPQTEENAD